jgi:gallate dioxygenase
MARIIGAIASSHTPTIGFAFDRNKQDDPVWAPIFEAYRPIQAWLADKRPDVLLFIYNDPSRRSFSTTIPRSRSASANRLRLPTKAAGRALPPVKGHPGLAAHWARP